VVEYFIIAIFRFVIDFTPLPTSPLKGGVPFPLPALGEACLPAGRGIGDGVKLIINL